MIASASAEMRRDASSHPAPTSGRGALLRRIWLPASVLALMLLALALRVWRLNQVPPGLWWDEATQGLDAADLLAGHFHIFFTSALGKEPLYIYLTTPFVAAWFGQPFAVRLAGALLSVLMVPVLYATGRALFIEHPRAGAWTGITAALLWATNFWAQSISRIGFQVNAFPLLLATAVLAWLNYSHSPNRRRAIVFGIIAGLTLYTYLAARFTPLLWLALFLVLPRRKQRAMRASLVYAVVAFVLVFLPLGVYFALHPADFFGRISTFGVAQGAAAVVKPETLPWATRLTVEAFLGLVGDPIARHNLPDQPSFTPVAAALFGLGLLTGLAAVVLRRKQGALTALLWWVLLCVPAILSRSSTPHYPRLYGALPAAMLVAALPVGLGVVALHHVRSRTVAAALSLLLAALLIFETTHTAQAYFVRWAQQTDLYTFYQQDLWSFGEKVRATRGAVGVVALNEGYGSQLDYAFSDVPIYQLPAGEPDVAAWLDAHLGQSGGREVLSLAWGQGANQDADPKQLLQHYLAREGERVSTQPFRGFQVETFRLGDQPQFAARGQRAVIEEPFESGVTLQEARWGTAYPNADRSGNAGAAGTAFWVVLTWRLASSQPDLRTAADLLDEAGHRLASAEAPLMDLRERGAAWQPGKTVQTYHLVTVPATQVPGPLVLAARLYNTKTGAPVLLQQPSASPYEPGGPNRLRAAFAQPTAEQALTPPTPTIARPLNQPFSRGLTLLGADDWPATVRPGERFTVRLYWQLTEALPAARTFDLTVLGPQAPAAMTRVQLHVPAGLRIPAAIATITDVAVGPDLAPGLYTLNLEDAQGQSLALGQVMVAGRPKAWEAPRLVQETPATFGSAVSLLGIDAPAVIPVAAGQTVTVTLGWRVLQPPPGEIARFVHVLGPDGRPVTQRSGVPCAGWDAASPDDACPSTAWLPDEVLADTVSLVLPADLPPGRYPLATGWYDPQTLERLPARDAAGQPAPDNLFRLPVELLVGGGG